MLLASAAMKYHKDGESESSVESDKIAELMPHGLVHQPGADYNHADSEVVQWLTDMTHEQIEELMEGPRGAIWFKVFNWIVAAPFRRKAIYPENGLWRGAGAGYTEARIARVRASRKGKSVSPETQFKAKWTDEEIIAALKRDPSWKECSTVTWVDALDIFLKMPERTAFRRIKELRAAGKLPGPPTGADPEEAPVEL